MGKEYLEAFESIMKIYGNTNSLGGTYNYFLFIKKALHRLEAIDNANPSEALKYLDKIKTRFRDTCLGMYLEDTKEFTTIKQALLKAQELEKENKLLKEIIKGMEI